MAKKIRQVKLVEEDINKNSGKEISHTISKIKAHERLYTFVLVVIFMFTISITAFLGLKVDSYQLYDASYFYSHFSMKGQNITLSKKNIMSDVNGLVSKPYTLEYNNNTNKNINFIVRFAKDEEETANCNCANKIIDYHKIKYSIDGVNVKQFTDDAMIISAGMVQKRSGGTFTVRLWLDESLKNKDDCLYYGKFILEELEDMDH